MSAETVDISEHMCRVLAFLLDSGWATSREIAAGARVAPRTARQHVKTLVTAGLVDRAEVFPGPRYRFSERAEQRNGGLLKRIERAGEIFARRV